MMISNIKDQSVGEIVAADHRTAFVFKSHGIDFCCGGKKNVANACASKNVDVNELEKEIASILAQPVQGMKFNDWKVDFLVDYIVNNHHVYVKNKLPELLYISEKVARVHGERDSELLEMYALVQELHSELMNHLNKEETELFPLIKKLDDKDQSEYLSNLLLTELEDEHELAGSMMQKLETLSNNFTPPKEACTSYTIYFKTLKEFQDDLHMHVHLENNILFPKVLILLDKVA